MLALGKSSFLAAVCLACTPLSLWADTSGLGNGGDRLRIRVGDNGNGSTNTVIFDVPGANLGDGTPVPSINPISGASGNFTVRIVMDTRRIGNDPATGQFFGNSSLPMACVTPPNCGSETAPMGSISWSHRDGGDMMEQANSFNNGNQLLHTQIQPRTGPNAPGQRERDYLQFTYDNNLFLPAGTYRGTVNFSAVLQ